ncbi:MAG: tetraacyldisaccharide 4'-kinase, partial [Terriglobia bacterium]
GAVISVGNLTVGGTGKTPLVLRLATWLGSRGLHVAILTRGYGRRARMPLVINGQGETKHYTPELMGDEPILLARRLPQVTIGIGTDRYAVGQQIVQMEAPHPPAVFLLDDGFQHQRLARDLDVVLVDARQPFDGGALLPAGGLREPLAALARADVIVLTRTEVASAEEVLASIGRLNPQAPVFRATTRFLNALDPTTHRPANLYVLKQQPALAFCGVGNPEAFWEDLGRWGFNVVGTKAFPDHHRYKVEDFKVLMKEADRVGARALLTTEKDAVNFTVIVPSHPPTFYCRIDLALEDEPGFFAALAERLQAAAAR